MKESPLYFIEKVWGLKPQPPKEEYKRELRKIARLTGESWEEHKHDVKAHWFGDPYDENGEQLAEDEDYDAQDGVTVWRWEKFQKGLHLSWQQYMILLGVEKGLSRKARRSISIASGRGIGKSATLSWIMLWFLFCHPDCQIPCTAPSADQMYDVLWKEVALWIQRMPAAIKAMYQWESSHIRMVESPATWFARAKTASKDKPEALSGVHADHVLALVDEGSAIDDAIFEASTGIFSSENAYFIMISNPTRRTGFFFDSHHKNRSTWQTFQFSSEQSPLVHDDLIEKYGDDGVFTDKYRINVKGLFPKEDAIDAKSYVQLLSERTLQFISPEVATSFHNAALGVDPAGEGDNETAYVVRDNFTAMVVGLDTHVNAKQIAQRVITIADKYKIKPKFITNDAFGVGADVGKEVAMAVRWNINTLNVGQKCNRDSDREQFANEKARIYWAMKRWIERGGQLVEHRKLKEQLLSIRFRRSMSGRIEIMSKREMRKEGMESPDLVDALALTFYKDISVQDRIGQQNRVLEQVPFDQWGI